MGAMRGVKAAAAAATMAAAALVTAPAGAAYYAVDAHVDGVPGGGNYGASSFHWDEPFQASFTHATDGTTAALQGMSQSKQEVGYAFVRQSLVGTATVTLQMYGVHVETVREAGDANAPQETVVLRFRKVVYTFQPLLPNGQKAGPAVSFTWGH